MGVADVAGGKPSRIAFGPWCRPAAFAIRRSRVVALQVDDLSRTVAAGPGRGLEQEEHRRFGLPLLDVNRVLHGSRSTCRW